MNKLEGMKVVTAAEMARIEKIAYSRGASDRAFMENAGKAIAEIVFEMQPKKVTLLIGKGNNGGDAFVAGTLLLAKGVSVKAITLFAKESCSPLCRMMHEVFLKAGGRVQQKCELEGLLLDGIFGTGFSGKVEGIAADVIERVNQSGLPVVAIDIPSGLCGTTGHVETVAIKATETIFLGVPKLGFFLNKGWDHVGKLRHADFGLDLAEAHPSAYLFNDRSLPHLLPPIQRTRHKYQRGYVLAFAGSPGMPGAALLATSAALRAGAGIVRLFYSKDMESEFNSAPDELIREKWDVKKIKKEAFRAKSVLIGPGMGTTKQAKLHIEKLLSIFKVPMVLDADALTLLGKQKIPPSCVLTPQRKELEHLLGSKDVSLENCQKFVEKNKTTLVFKGAPTFIFHPKTLPLIMTHGAPGMATAGAGDVLTGIIAALLAQGLESRVAAAVGVTLHGLAGELAAEELTSYCVVASDLIRHLPGGFDEASKIE